ncbi:hypothetical protein GO755_33630 [Spirosoma sp. HMF4905]|uniref:Uncharacterized protein n=1 Tax=Spirosoma arboris TaxID=2682092 RepID=A0A7K1SML2_9BACT|nr:hypothetical protein [Spirosoma arboris]MVM35017.1 hypothetical protein [Spirosoma arboris]
MHPTSTTAVSSTATSPQTATATAPAPVSHTATAPAPAPVSPTTTAPHSTTVSRPQTYSMVQSVPSFQPDQQVSVALAVFLMAGAFGLAIVYALVRRFSPVN